jgi:hypothetical protein
MNLDDKKHTLIESDYDHTIHQRIITGRYTERRMNLIKEYCKERSGRIPVYSEYDCTGSLCGLYLNVEYSLNAFKITIRHAYDY